MSRIPPRVCLCIYKDMRGVTRSVKEFHVGISRSEEANNGLLTPDEHLARVIGSDGAGFNNLKLLNVAPKLGKFQRQVFFPPPKVFPSGVGREKKGED